MKSVVAICLLLVVVGEYAREWSGDNDPGPPPVVSTAPWVRTVDGWERLDTSPPPVPSATNEDRHPKLHPALVAIGMVLGSLYGLASRQSFTSSTTDRT